MKQEKSLRLTRVVLIEDELTNEVNAKYLTMYVHPTNIEFIQEAMDENAATEIYLYSRDVPYFVMEKADEIEEKLESFRATILKNNLFKNN